MRSRDTTVLPAAAEKASIGWGSTSQQSPIGQRMDEKFCSATNILEVARSSPCAGLSESALVLKPRIQVQSEAHGCFSLTSPVRNEQQMHTGR
mmetsp:Transcript_22018/g.89377  ORF Transcript_22018/g.89377 Transcript_22018/m.89377 type:complete len:93 (-) Transcript_22018:70-348(-)